MWRLLRSPLVFWLVRILVCIVIFLLAGVTLDVAQVLGLVLFLLDCFSGINPGGWRISSLVSVTFFKVLNLRLISDRRDIGLSFFTIFRSLIVVLPLGIFLVFFGQWMVAFWIS